MVKEVFVSLNNCTFSYTNVPTIKDLSITIHQSDKIALVGKNGVGKTTLMDIISKLRKPTVGEMWFNPGISIGYLKQKNFYSQNKLVNQYLENKFKNVEQITKTIKNVCSELKIDQFEKLINLSGGMMRKLALVELIISQPKMLLLDEPTNHLDIESIEWLENFLNKDFKGAFLVVSHDRKFLDNVTNKVFWMDRGNVKVSSKGFYNFDNWSQELIEHERRNIKNKENFLKNEKEWLSKGIKARRKRNEKRKENVSLFESNLKKEKSEFLRSISKIKFTQINDPELGPNVIAQFFNVNKNFLLGKINKKIIKNFNYKLVRGEKVGILGKNGVGKSTLLKLLIKKIQTDSGSVKLRDSIQYSYFDQKSEQINDSLSLKENLIPNGGDYLEVNSVKRHICGYLKNFLFDPAAVDDKVSTLSGGQKNRLLLAKILAKPKQLLLLDEPTNDLDLETLDLLKEYIKVYRGTVLIASHDRDFLDAVTEKIFFFSGDGEIEISFEKCSNLLKKNKLKLENHLKEKIKPENSKKKPISLDKKIKQILGKMEKLEKQIYSNTKIVQEIDFKHNNEKIFLISKKIQDDQQEIIELEKIWRELEEENLNE